MKRAQFPVKNFLKAAFVLSIVVFVFSCAKKEENAENHFPKAKYAVTPARGDVSTVFAFDADSVSDNEDPKSSLEVRWDWDNDGVWDTEFTTEKTAEFQYGVVGHYRPKLEVRDTKNLTDTIKQLVVIVSDLANQPPSMPIYFEPLDYQKYVLTETTKFRWSCTDPEDDALAFDLWLGRSSESLRLIRSDITKSDSISGQLFYVDTLYNVLQPNTEYFWQIAAKDPVGNYVPGRIWRFSTK
jgi:hypothetical protein